MTDKDDKDTRRAQRRAKQAEATQSLAKQDSDVQDSEGEGGEGEARRSGSGAGGLDQIRDRNARIRAEAAAERQKKRERERAPSASVPVGLDASERMDDILVRTTHAVTVWVRRNFKWLQWIVIGSAVGGLGWEGYQYFTLSAAARTTDATFLGVDAERGRVTGADESPEEANSPEGRLDNAPRFTTIDEQRAAAEANYRKAIAAHGKSNAGTFARLGLAGILFDQKKWDESLSLYRDVRASELAKLDSEVRGRALEGIGLCLEAKKETDQALQSFRELTNQEGLGALSVAGLYHQGRVLLARGDKDGAKKVLLDAKERLQKKDPNAAAEEGSTTPPTYLSKAVGRVLGEIDPSLATGMGEGNTLQELLNSDPALLQRYLDQMRNRQPQPAAPTGEPPLTPESGAPAEPSGDNAPATPSAAGEAPAPAAPVPPPPEPSAPAAPVPPPPEPSAPPSNEAG